MLGQLGKCWSAFYDGLALHGELETTFRAAVAAGSSPALPTGLSDATRNLAFATLAEIADYFLERRNYLETVATLDMAIHLESLIRDDRAARITGSKSQGSLLGQQLASCPAPHGQSEPAARKLMALWLTAARAGGRNYQTLDDALQYRNWLAHGARGASPVTALTPFALDQHLTDFSAYVAAEP